MKYFLKHISSIFLKNLGKSKGSHIHFTESDFILVNLKKIYDSLFQLIF